jgi:hypothetical protein
MVVHSRHGLLRFSVIDCRDANMAAQTRAIPPLFRFSRRPANPELQPALAIALETVKVRIRSGAAASQDNVLFNPRHTIFKFTGSKQ